MMPMKPDDEEGQQVADQGQPSGLSGMMPQQSAPDDTDGDQGSDDTSGEGPDDQDTGDTGDTGAPDDQGGDQQDQGGGVQGRKATPEQQAQYKQFVLQGIHAIYAGGKPNPAILNLLSSGDPKQALANASVNLVMRLVETAGQQGMKLDGAVILKGGQRLFEELADLSAAARIHKFTQGELDASWVIAMSLAQKRMMQEKLIDPRAFVRDVQEMNKAEAEGRVDDILPGLGSLVADVQKAKGAQAQGQPAAGGQQQDQGGNDGNAADAADAAPSQDDSGAPPSDDEDQQKPAFRGFGKGG